MSMKPAKIEAAGQVRALTAALQMMKERGYVVLGFHPIAMPMEPGDKQATFSNFRIPGHELVLETPTIRADWTAQGKAIFGPGFKDPNKWERGAQFFRCKLVPLEAPKI
jgi:hypothetical protein